MNTDNIRNEIEKKKLRKKIVSKFLFDLCAEHGANLTGASPVTGIYRQV